jgi:hypothetical protein
MFFSRGKSGRKKKECNNNKTNLNRKDETAF